MNIYVSKVMGMNYIDIFDQGKYIACYCRTDSNKKWEPVIVGEANNFTEKQLGKKYSPKQISRKEMLLMMI